LCWAAVGWFWAVRGVVAGLTEPGPGAASCFQVVAQPAGWWGRPRGRARRGWWRRRRMVGRGCAREPGPAGTVPATPPWPRTATRHRTRTGRPPHGPTSPRDVAGPSPPRPPTAAQTYGRPALKPPRVGAVDRTPSRRCFPRAGRSGRPSPRSAPARPGGPHRGRPAGWAGFTPPRGLATIPVAVTSRSSGVTSSRTPTTAPTRDSSPGEPPSRCRPGPGRPRPEPRRSWPARCRHRGGRAW